MDGRNKNVVQEIPSATSAWPKYPIAASTSVLASANPFRFISPSKPPISPTSFNYMGQKPYLMKLPGVGLAAGASSSGTQATTADQKHLPPPVEKLNLGPSPNTAVGNAVQSHGGRSSEQTMEQKKLRRVISNRLSAQRSRIRKLQHINDMEKKVESLQTLVAVLADQVQQQKEKQTFLRSEQKLLQNRLSACANRSVIVDAEIEEKKAEVKRLRELELTLQMRAQNRFVVPVEEMPINPCLNNPGTGQPLYFSSDQVDGEKDYIAEEINRMNQLNLQQEDPGHMMLPGWEAAVGDFTNVGLALDHSGPEQLQNPFPNQPQQLQNPFPNQPQVELQNPFPNQPQQQQVGSFSSGFGELEKIFNFKPRNDSGLN